MRYTQMNWIYVLWILLVAGLQAEEDFRITHHTIQLGSAPLSYTATTGTLPLFNGKVKTVDLFFLSFVKDGEDLERPITFVIPGGPGGAGTIGSLISLGPRRLLTADEGRSILPPYRIIDNQETVLDLTDLVFIDPPDCGYSATTDEANSAYFYSVEGDIQTLGEFIHAFVSTFDRWNSPKYLAGNSYGSFRCSGLSLNLFQYDILIQGLILDGCAIEHSTLESQRNRALPDCLLIPTFAADAWYHGRVWPDKPLEEVVDYARRFAFDSYAPLMLQPSRLNPIERENFYREFAQLIGLPVDTIRKYKGRINAKTFTTEFFGSQRKILGDLDGRYTGDVGTIDPFLQADPSYLDSLGMGAAFKVYLHKELDTKITDSPYVDFSRDILYQWNASSFDSRGEPDFLQRLSQAMIYNPQMKIFVGCGYYDARTPFAATEYSFDHLDLPFSYWESLQFEYYEAGHGLILDSISLRKLKKDLARFYSK